ncbi:hypothetical protein JOF56_003016 [Kibdelosporangium banguiense]|uniref:WXG100 family type VII secretion target n=1 Tax=Kibdelosporangium banguiense TaxID=1365924 RepID=A0ABS4TFM0_9PSEU|nr:hypothetical protein [Kibdelosporangium banguiense]MBP2322631.1 hypothetical protein [Kibdelosporangium banguiense]
MSHLAREIDRQLVWIEKHADDLMATVKDLSADVRAEMQGPGWDEVQCQAIRLALNNWGDNCGRSIMSTEAELRAFRQELVYALRQL